MVKLDFFVIQGPNNLLGRHALESMWPSQFNALREIAEVPNVSTAPIANKAKVRAAGKKPRQRQQKSQVSSVQSAVLPKRAGESPDL